MRTNSPARSQIFFFAPSTQVANSWSLTTRTAIGMKAWSLPQSSEHWP